MNKLFCAVGLLALACGDGSGNGGKGAGGTEVEPFDQVFKTRESGLNPDSCIGFPTEDPRADPYFRLVQTGDDLSELDYFTCRTPEDCNDFTFDAWSFYDFSSEGTTITWTEDDEGNWTKGQSYGTMVSQDGESQCTLTYIQTTLTRGDDGSVTLQEFQYIFGTDGANNEEACDDVAATITAPTGDCYQVKQLIGEAVVEE